MASAWIVKANDNLEDRVFCVTMGFPAVAPNQLCLAKPRKLLRGNDYAGGITRPTAEDLALVPFVAIA